MIPHNPDRPGLFADDDHAFRTGLALGTLIDAGLDASPVMVGADYTATITLRVPLPGGGRDVAGPGVVELLLTVQQP